MGAIFALLLAFQIKHFLCDFPLQGKYMLGKFSAEKHIWIPALSLHCLVHAVATALIASFFIFCVYDTVSISFPLYFGIFDFVMHFTMDRIKASPRLLGVWKPDQPQFWYALGIDQAFHHLTHYVVIWFLVT